MDRCSSCELEIKLHSTDWDNTCYECGELLTWEIDMKKKRNSLRICRKCPKPLPDKRYYLCTACKTNPDKDYIEDYHAIPPDKWHPVDKMIAG